MRSSLQLAVDGLAVTRAARLFAEDEITAPLRQALIETGNDKLAYLATCPHCISVWAGAAIASGLVPRPVRYALALSEISIISRRVLDALPVRW